MEKLDDLGPKTQIRRYCLIETDTAALVNYLDLTRKNKSRMNQRH